MRDITKEMIRIFRIDKLGFDFMGYTFKRKDDLSFHHLVVPHRECKKAGLGDGYQFWNGSVLVQSSSHEYLHTIEYIDSEAFYAITSEMIDENMLRSLEIANLKRIRNILLSLEREHCSDTNKKGKYLIKESYVKDRIKL